MSITKRESIKIMLRAKMNKFCKENSYTIDEFLSSININKNVWFNLTSGKDVFFDAIVKIVENTNNYFEYEDFAELFAEENTIV